MLSGGGVEVTPFPLSPEVTPFLLGGAGADETDTASVVSFTVDIVE